MASLLVTRCVICNSAGAQPVLTVEQAPVHPFRPADAAHTASGFGRLAVVQCTACGHLYNAGFDPDRADELYGAFVLTNTPVSASMVQALEETAEYILRRAKGAPVVLEVGGGGGALALAMAQRASIVHLVEPSRALSADRFAGSRVVFHQTMFPTPALGDQRFDAVVCRQVLEHVPWPGPFLAALRARLAEDGVAYIEVPSGEYIRDSLSIIDFHYPHVHYYRRPTLETLFARAGFAITDIVSVKDGHDTGFLLRPVAPSERQASASSDGGYLPAAFAARRAGGRERLEGLRGAVGLYGANAYSQALLALYPDFAGFRAMFDDTPQYKGQRAYGPGHDLTIGPPSMEQLESLEAVVITAYLHDLVIARKLRALGFGRPIYTLRSDSAAGKGEVPPGLFI